MGYFELLNHAAGEILRLRRPGTDAAFIEELRKRLAEERKPDVGKDPQPEPRSGV